MITLASPSVGAVNSIFIAYCNCAFVDVEIFDDDNVSIYSETINIKRPIESIYFSTLAARRIVLTMDLNDGIAAWVLGYRADLILSNRWRITGGDFLITEDGDFLLTEDGEYLVTENSIDGHALTITGDDLSFDYDSSITSNVKIKGVGFGNADKFNGALWDRKRSRSSTTTSVRSPMGQVMRNKGVVLRAYTLTVPNLNINAFRDLDDKLTFLDKDYPIYVDITDNTGGSEDPIYATVDDNWSVSDRGQGQDISIPILEAK